MAFFCIHCKTEIDPKYKACPFCGEPITDFLRRYLEHPIDGKYQILARLGVGGMGEVFKVLHTHLNQIRVIKLMRSNIAAESGAHDRFLREARLATRINHPNVGALYDFSTLEDGSRYMVWEYIEGINLHQLIDERGPLSPRYAAKLAAQALHGLEAVHRAGIVHRDVSPENLMITRDDEGEERVKIIDLGIAKQWEESEDNKTKTGMFVGKWKYCSPEHLGMLPAGERIDGRADIYSFGIVLYEMLTGVPPFQADTPHMYLMMHSTQRPRPLREANPQVDAAPELEALILKALEKDRNKRFASAREFAQTIERITPALSDAPGAPPPLPPTSEITDKATREEPRPKPDAPTVLTEIEVGKTIETPAPPSERTLDRRGFAEEPAGVEPRKRVPLIAIAAMLVMVFGIAGWVIMNNRTGKPIVKPLDRPIPKPVEPKPLPVAAGHLGINAFPWGNVTSIRNLDSGQAVEMKAPLVTPAPIDLPPGRYEVTLANPNFDSPITRTISIASGGDETLTVHFTDPARAALPDFGAVR